MPASMVAFQAKPSKIAETINARTGTTIIAYPPLGDAGAEVIEHCLAGGGTFLVGDDDQQRPLLPLGVIRAQCAHHALR